MLIKLLKEILDNFYRHIIQHNSNIKKYLNDVNNASFINVYKGIVEKVYNAEVDGSINNSDVIQNKLIDDFKQLEYLLERLSQLNK
jgi:hypothetical protein